MPAGAAAYQSDVSLDHRLCLAPQRAGRRADRRRFAADGGGAGRSHLGRRQLRNPDRQHAYRPAGDGQRDVYGDDVVYQGKVAGIDMGTGSAFSLLPAQNATGNWIKVVQRLPVRIELDAKQVADHPLRIGLLRW